MCSLCTAALLLRVYVVYSTITAATNFYCLHFSQFILVISIYIMNLYYDTIKTNFRLPYQQ